MLDLRQLPASVFALKRRGDRLATLEPSGLTLYRLPDLTLERRWQPPAPATALDLDDQGRLWAACRDGHLHCEDGTVHPAEGTVTCLSVGPRIAYGDVDVSALHLVGQREPIYLREGPRSLDWVEDGRWVAWGDRYVHCEVENGHHHFYEEGKEGFPSQPPRCPLLEQLRSARRQPVDGPPVLACCEPMPNLPPLDRLASDQGLTLLSSRKQFFVGPEAPPLEVPHGLNRWGLGRYLYACFTHHPCGADGPSGDLLVCERDGRLVFRGQNLMVPWQQCQPFAGDGSWMFALHTHRDELLQIQLPSGEVTASVPLSWRVGHGWVDDEGVVYLSTQGCQALSWRPGEQLTLLGPGCAMPFQGQLLRWDDESLKLGQRTLLNMGWPGWKGDLVPLSDRLLLLVTPRLLLLDLVEGQIVADLGEPFRYLLSPDKRWLATGAARIGLWDLAGPFQVAEANFNHHYDLVFGLGHLLAWKREEATVHCLRLPDLRKNGQLRAEAGAVRAVAALDAETTLTLGLYGDLQRWRNLNAVPQLSPPEREYVAMRALSDPAWAELRDRHQIPSPPPPPRPAAPPLGEEGDLYEVSPVEAARRLGSPEVPFALLRLLDEQPAGTNVHGHQSAQGFSPDGDWWVHHHHGSPNLEVVDLARGRRHTLRMAGSHHPHLVLTADHRLLVGNGQAALWQLEETPRSLPLEPFPDIYGVAASPQGEVAGYSLTALVRWDREGRLVGQPHSLREQPWGLKYSPDGQTLALSYARQIQLVGAWQTLLPGHRAAFSPDGSLLATVGNGALELWDFTRRRRLLRSEIAGFRADAFLILPDHSGALVGGDCGGPLCYWRFDQPDRLLPIHAGLRDAHALTPDGRLLALGTGNNRVVLVDVPSWRMIGAADAGSYGTVRVAFDRHGGLWAASGDLRLFHYEISSHRPLSQSRQGLLEYFQTRIPRPAPTELYIGTPGEVDPMKTLDQQNALWDFLQRLVHRQC